MPSRPYSLGHIASKRAPISEGGWLHGLHPAWGCRRGSNQSPEASCQLSPGWSNSISLGSLAALQSSVPQRVWGGLFFLPHPDEPLLQRCVQRARALRHAPDALLACPGNQPELQACVPGRDFTSQMWTLLSLQAAPGQFFHNLLWKRKCVHDNLLPWKCYSLPLLHTISVEMCVTITTRGINLIMLLGPIYMHTQS